MHKVILRIECFSCKLKRLPSRLLSSRTLGSSAYTLNAKIVERLRCAKAASDERVSVRSHNPTPVFNRPVCILFGYLSVHPCSFSLLEDASNRVSFAEKQIGFVFFENDTHDRKPNQDH